MSLPKRCFPVSSYRDAIDRAWCGLGATFEEFMSGEAAGGPFSDLNKGGGHKYIMRLRNPSPPPKWRYIYKVYHRGKFVGSKEHLEPGSKLRIENDPMNAHLEVLSVIGDKIRVKHSITEEVFEHTETSLREHVMSAHSGAITMYKQALKRRLKNASDRGSIRMDTRLAEYAAQFGVRATGEFELDPREGWGGGDSVVKKLHSDSLPPKTSVLPESVRTFPNPKGEKTALMDHQVEGAERALDSFQLRDGFLLQDETGLGKALTALATVVGYGGHRSLYIVPENGKEALKSQLMDNARLYGIDLSDASTSSISEPGVFVASYQEIYDTYYDEDGIKRAKLKPAYENGFDMVVFDECQNMKNPRSTRSQACMELQEKSGKVLYVSATPFTNLRDMHYLRKLGVFKNGDEFVDWATKIGATISGKAAPGDLPSEINNPKSPLPLVAAAAYMHFNGMTLRRSPNMAETMETKFEILPKSAMRPDHKKALDGANRIRQIALDAGLSPFSVGGQMTMWSKQHWECVKVDSAISTAIDALDRGRSVSMFYSFKQFDHGPLKGMRDMLNKKGSGIDPEVARLAIAEIDSILENMPTLDPIGEVRDALAEHVGSDKIAEIHGGARTNSKKEREAFQRNEKWVMIGTIDKAGTGMSFHDKVGPPDGRPRTQINNSLPWTADKFQQLNGRSHRIGSKTNTENIYLLGDSDTERECGAIVARKCKSMGAAISGDTGAIPTAEALANWEFSVSGTDEDLVEGIKAAASGIDVSNDDASVAKEHFKRFIDEMHEGKDPFESVAVVQMSAKDAKNDLGWRSAAAELHAAGYTIERHGSVWRIKGEIGGKTKKGVSMKQTAHERSSDKRRDLWGGLSEPPMKAEKVSVGVFDIVVRHPMAFSFLANKMRKKGHVPPGDHGAVAGWSGEDLKQHKASVKHTEPTKKSFGFGDMVKGFIASERGL
jgi:hypothetical protein